MTYSNNPNLPRVRREAVNFVLRGYSTREAARHFGYSQGAIVKWLKRAPANRRTLIQTLSSKPHHHPNEIDKEIVYRILELRHERNECAEIIHHKLKKEKIIVSLSSVKRALKRHGLIYPSKWKKWHKYPPKPIPERPGVLIQIDSMREGVPQECLHAYALIDVCSRWGYVEATEKISTHLNAHFLQKAQKKSPFTFQTIQSDHGQEFSKWFTKKCLNCGFAHRHSRVRTPTDNAHVERFIQTFQKQCLNRVPRSINAWRKEIPDFLKWYNTERPHMALGMKTPAEVITSY